MRKARLPDGMRLEIFTSGKKLKKIGAKAFMEFINPFIRERAYLSLLKPQTLPMERKWLLSMVQSLDGKKAIMLVLFDGGRIAGTCEIRKGVLQNAASNAHFGLAIAKQYRGKGYGELLLRKGIEIAKRKFNPHRMWIEHVEGNAPAARLYKKLGFYEIARQNEYINHFGKWRDHVLMQYKGK